MKQSTKYKKVLLTINELKKQLVKYQLYQMAGQIRDIEKYVIQEIDNHEKKYN